MEDELIEELMIEKLLLISLQQAHQPTNVTKMSKDRRLNAYSNNSSEDLNATSAPPRALRSSNQFESKSDSKQLLTSNGFRSNPGVNQKFSSDYFEKSLSNAEIR